jgi:phenylalanyl-tRNA synthetase beta chain
MDIAVVVGEEIDSQAVEDVVRVAGGDLLRHVRPFDVYRGEQVGEGEKSLAYNLTFFADDRTLRDEEVRAVYDAIVEALRRELGGGIRGL